MASKSASAGSTRKASGGPARQKSERVLTKRRAGHSTRRPRAAADAGDDNSVDGQFVVALARGLEILRAFRAGEGRIGNQELAERTGLTKPTISRLTHTLTKLGFLNYNQRQSTYELGGGALALGFVALSSIDIRASAKPLMQELADRTGFNVGLGMRDRSAMIYTETCEGKSMVNLALRPGSRVPIMTSAMGRAYLLGLPEEDREAVLKDVFPRHADDWPLLMRQLEHAGKEYESHGFCTSLGDWHKDINGVAVPVTLPLSQHTYALNLGGPAYMLTREQIFGDFGPALAGIAKRLVQAINPSGNS